MLRDVEVDNEDDLIQEIASLTENINQGKQVKRNTERKEELLPLLQLVERKKAI
jgi:hypothetical protein